MVVMFFANGFEETEAIAPLDIMRRAGLDVVTVSINETAEVVGSHGITYTADTTADKLDADGTYEAVILPGGMPGTTNLGNCDKVCETLKNSAAKGSVIAAICAAPSVLGGLGLLAGKKAVCYPGFESELMGATISGLPAVCDGKVITAKGPGATVDFAAEIITKLKGAGVAAELKESMQCQ